MGCLHSLVESPVDSYSSAWRGFLAEHNYCELRENGLRERDKVDLVEGEYGRLSMSLLEGFKEQNSI